MKSAALTILTITFVAACATNPAARKESVRYGRNIQKVELGQSMLEVLSVMGTDPASRIRSLGSDGTNVEQWIYVTDYENDTATALTFTNRLLTQIRQERWDGAYTVNSIHPTEDLTSEKEIRARTPEKP